MPSSHQRYLTENSATDTVKHSARATCKHSFVIFLSLNLSCIKLHCHSINLCIVQKCLLQTSLNLTSCSLNYNIQVANGFFMKLGSMPTVLDLVSFLRSFVI